MCIHLSCSMSCSWKLLIQCLNISQSQSLAFHPELVHFKMMCTNEQWHHHIHILSGLVLTGCGLDCESLCAHECELMWINMDAWRRCLFRAAVLKLWDVSFPRHNTPTHGLRMCTLLFDTHLTQKQCLSFLRSAQCVKLEMRSTNSLQLPMSHMAQMQTSTRLGENMLTWLLSQFSSHDASSSHNIDSLAFTWWVWSHCP